MKPFVSAVCLGVMGTLALSPVPRCFSCGPSFPENVLSRGNSIAQSPRPSFALELESIALDTVLPGKLRIPDHIPACGPSNPFSDTIYPAINKLFRLSGDDILKNRDDCHASLMASHSDLARGVCELADALQAKVNAGRLSADRAGLAIEDYRAVRAVMRGQDAPRDGMVGQRVDDEGTRRYPAYWIDPDALAVTEQAIVREEWPVEIPPEFALYLTGANAFRNGDIARARATFEQLLSLPSDERQYRSTWAAFMLGRCRLAEGDPDFQSIEHFRQVLRLREQGFLDSLGLGWDSLRCLADHALRSDNKALALRYYFALARVGYHEEIRTLSKLMSTGDLDATAQDPFLRRVMTAVLLQQRHRDFSWDQPQPRSGGGSTKQSDWLTVLEDAEVTTNETPRIAWIAYNAGRFSLARRWMQRHTGNDFLALWLRSKFAAQDGNLQHAKTFLEDAAKEITREVTSVPQFSSLDDFGLDHHEIQEYRHSQLYADLAVACLAANDYVGALDAFMHSGHWGDAAYVAEQLLAIDELLPYTRRVSSTPVVGKDAATGRSRNMVSRLRYLTARRLVRIRYFNDARALLPKQVLPAFDLYVSSYRTFLDRDVPQNERAQAGWLAAQTLRAAGGMLTGTEVGPDWMEYGGHFDAPDYTLTRLRKNPTARIDSRPRRYRNPNNAEAIEIYPQEWLDSKLSSYRPPLIAPTQEERWRHNRYAKLPNMYRYHYRHTAADLAWLASLLMPDDSDETARVLGTAGLWLAPRSPQPADLFYKALIWRNWSTELARKADRKRWFPTVEWTFDPWREAGAERPNNLLRHW